MNVFIIHNKTKEGSYADSLFHLLILFFQERGFALLVNHGISEVKETEAGKLNTAVVLHTGKNKLSFFTRLALGRIIRKKEFDYIIQIADSKLVSSRLPQLIISNDTGIYHTGKVLPNVSFSVCSNAEKQRISEQDALLKDSIMVIAPVTEDRYQPVSWTEQQSIKMQYTQAREYFFVFAQGKTIQSFTELLKAFSTFKKWQHSGMKLVVAGSLPFTQTGEWIEKISTYRFREDIVLPDNLNTADIIQIFAGAYAFIHLPEKENDVLPLLQAMQCETPCITFATDSITEYAEESAIVIEQGNYDQLAEKMILVYKDEALRSHLISKGKERSGHYSKEKTFAAFAEVFSLPFH